MAKNNTRNRKKNNSKVQQNKNFLQADKKEIKNVPIEYFKIFLLWVWGFSWGGPLNFYSNNPYIFYFPTIITSIIIIYFFYKYINKSNYHKLLKTFSFFAIILICTSLFLFASSNVKKKKMQDDKARAIEQQKDDDNLHIKNGVSELQNTVDKIYSKILEDVQGDKGFELSYKYPLGYTLFTLEGKNQIVHFSKPNSEPLQTSWDNWSLTIADSMLILHAPDIFVPPNTKIFSTDFILPNVIGALASLSIAPNSGNDMERNIIYGTLPEEIGKRKKILFSGGVQIKNNNFGPIVVESGINPSIELVVEILTDSPKGRVLVMGLRKIES